MDTELMSAGQVLEEYQDDIRKLEVYLPWLIEKSQKRASQIYGQDGIATHSLPFPVFDSNLLRFVKDAEQTKFMDRNYLYVYSRYHLRNSSDEIALIHKTTIQQMNILGGILSKYVLGGRTKARLWSMGVEEGVFLEAVQKAKELVDFWENATVHKSEDKG